MVWENQSHDIAAWENSRSFQSLNTVCFGDNNDILSLVGAMQTTKMAKKKRGIWDFLSFLKSLPFPSICLIFRINQVSPK